MFNDSFGFLKLWLSLRYLGNTRKKSYYAAFGKRKEQIDFS